MKFKILLATLLLSLISFSQTTKIKVKKAEPLYKATIAGIENGEASLKKILAQQQLSVTNEKDGIKIFSYQAFIVQDENPVIAQLFNGKNKTLSDELLEKIQEAYKLGPTTLRFKKILAYNSFNETIQLNDIEVKLVK